MWGCSWGLEQLLRGRAVQLRGAVEELVVQCQKVAWKDWDKHAMCMRMPPNRFWNCVELRP
eukprot:2772375-Alexandrium_andersonii.AAC.1